MVVNKIEAVAFDLDGTLCDSVPDLAAAANAMRQSLGMDELPINQVQSYVGDGVGLLVHRALTEHYDGMAEQNLWERGFNEFVRFYYLNIANQTRLYPEVEATLGLIKTLGLPLAVVTNKSEKLAVKLLEDLNIRDYFSIVVGGDTLPERKPAAEPLLFVADVLGVQPENLLMVGDSHNDILCARAAKCAVLGVNFGYGNMVQLSSNPDTAPDGVIGKLSEVYDFINSKKYD